MCLFMSKFNNFVFYGGAVTGTNPLNRTGEQRSAIQIGADNLMSLRVGVNKIAGQLRSPGSGRTLRIDRVWHWEMEIVHPGTEEAEIEGDFAAWLKEGLAEIDGLGIETRRGACLKSS